MRSKLEAYNDRQKNRFYTKVKIVTSWFIYGISGWVATYLIPNITNILIGIGYLFGLTSFFWYVFYFPTESYEIDICSHFSKASNFLGLSMPEKGKAAERHRKKSANEVEKALEYIRRLIDKTAKSEIMEKSMHGRLFTLKTNIEKFVLPRIILGEDLVRMQSILNGLQKFFEDQWESLGIEHLDETNKNLADLGAPSKEIRTYMSTLRELIKRKPAIIGLSLFIGFAISTAMIGGICGAVSVNFAEWVKSNINYFMIAGIAMSALISEVLVRS